MVRLPPTLIPLANCHSLLPPQSSDCLYWSLRAIPLYSKCGPLRFGKPTALLQGSTNKGNMHWRAYITTMYGTSRKYGNASPKSHTKDTRYITCKGHVDRLLYPAVVCSRPLNIPYNQFSCPRVYNMSIVTS